MTSIKDKADHVRAAKQTRSHVCHWPGCTEQVPPAKWGCSKHWYKLPKQLRDAVWRAYRPGQEHDLGPSEAYLMVAAQVQKWIMTQVAVPSPTRFYSPKRRDDGGEDNGR